MRGVSAARPERQARQEPGGSPARGAAPGPLSPAHVAELIPAVWRTLPWRALGSGAAMGLVIAGTTRVWEEHYNPWLALNTLRASALAFALGMAFLLDDPARHTTATVPTPRPLRQALRLAVVAPFAALSWIAAILLVPTGLRPPLGPVTLEAITAGVLALALGAAWIRRSQEPEPGVSIAVALLTLAVLTLLLIPEDWTLFVDPDDPRWADSHERWWGVLAAAVTLAAVWAREPLGRRGYRRSGA